MSHHEMYHGVVSFIITGDIVAQHSPRDPLCFKSEKGRNPHSESGGLDVTAVL